jgi:hypothetical protein
VSENVEPQKYHINKGDVITAVMRSLAALENLG